MKKYWYVLTHFALGLFSSSCSENSGKSQGSGEDLKTCASTKDTSITYTTTDACQPGYIEISSSKQTGPTSVPVEL